jgi:predicted transcriptional regulator YdeE
MKFYGVKKLVKFNDDYAQFQAIDNFWDQMTTKYPGVGFLCLGLNWGQDSFDYYIGKLDDNWADGLEAIELPDEGWKEFRCPRNDSEIKEMYRQIWDEGKLKYEIEDRLGDVLKVRVYYVKDDRSVA